MMPSPPPVTAPDRRSPNDPYCANCSYPLKGLTESSKCPECGKPLVEVLQRGVSFARSKRYRSPYSIFGLPLIDIASGPDAESKMGKARGIIAIGDQATGWLAIGGFARGIIAFGGFALGLIAFGGMSVGGLAIGGWALGLVALGGGAVGGFANGGGAVGFVAQGGGAFGYYARAGGALGKYVDCPARRDPEATRFFSELNRTLLFGRPLASMRNASVLIGAVVIFWALLAIVAVAAPLALIVWLEWRRRYGGGATST